MSNFPPQGTKCADCLARGVNTQAKVYAGNVAICWDCDAGTSPAPPPAAKDIPIERVEGQRPKAPVSSGHAMGPMGGEVLAVESKAPNMFRKTPVKVVRGRVGNRIPDEIRQNIRDEAARGDSWADIGVRYKVSRASIANILSEVRKSKPEPPKAEVRVEVIGPVTIVGNEQPPLDEELWSSELTARFGLTPATDTNPPEQAEEISFIEAAQVVLKQYKSDIEEIDVEIARLQAARTAIGMVIEGLTASLAQIPAADPEIHS